MLGLSSQDGFGRIAHNLEKKLMNLALWIVAGVLSVSYLMSGGGKLIMTKDKYAARAEWAEDFRVSSLKAIGALEVLGAVGVVLPAALGTAPVLVPLAALGLAIIMIGAVITRIRRGEFKHMVGDLVYLAMAGFVAWGRFGPESFVG